MHCSYETQADVEGDELEGDDVAERAEPILIRMTSADRKRLMANDEEDTNREFKAIKEILERPKPADRSVQSFLIPSGMTGQTTMVNLQVAWGKCCHMLCQYRSRQEAIDLAGAYLTVPSDRSLARERFESICSNDPDGTRSVDELIVRPEIVEVLGTNVIYVPDGKELPADRRWIREQLHNLMGHGVDESRRSTHVRRRAVISRIVVYIPANIVAGNGRISDPPGTNDQDQLNRYMLLQALNSADTVLAMNRSNFSATQCLDALLPPDCNFLQRLSEEDSDCSLILMHYREKEKGNISLNTFLTESERRNLEEECKEIETATDRFKPTLIRRFLYPDDEGVMDESEEAVEEMEKRSDRMEERTKIVTAFPSLFASLLLNHEGALRVIHDYETFSMDRPQDGEDDKARKARYEKKLEQALEFTNGYKLLGLLEELCLNDCRKLGDRVRDAVTGGIDDVAVATEAQGLQASGHLKKLKFGTLVRQPAVNDACRDAEDKLLKACNSVCAELNPDRLKRKAGGRLNKYKDDIKQMPMEAINPIYKGDMPPPPRTSSTNKGKKFRPMKSIRELVFGNLEKQSGDLSAFTEGVHAAVKQFLDSVASIMRDLLEEEIRSKCDASEDALNFWLNNCIPKAIKFLEPRLERFFGYKRRNFNKKKWLDREIEEAVGKALEQKLRPIHRQLSSAAARDRKRTRRIASLPLGEDGANRLVEEADSIIDAAMEIMSKTLQQELMASFADLLRDFGNSKTERCQRSLLQKLGRALLASPAASQVSRSNLKSDLEASKEQLDKLLDQEIQSTQLGRIVAINVPRVALLEDLYARCSFWKINEKLRKTVLSTGRANVSAKPKKPPRNLLIDPSVFNDDAHQELEQLLAHNSLEIQDVEADGDCLFHSLALNFWGQTSALRSLQLRIAICQYILYRHTTQEARQRFRNRNGLDVEDYVQNMSRPGTWGDHIIIEAFADLVERPVFVWQVGLRDSFLMYGGHHQGRDPAHIGHVNFQRRDGVLNHFVYVRPQSQMVTRQSASQSATASPRVTHQLAQLEGPQPEFAPPLPEEFEEGEVREERQGRLFVVLDTNAIIHVDPFETFEDFYDLLPQDGSVVIMVPTSVEEELDYRKDSNQDRGAMLRARRYFNAKEREKYQRIFMRQNRVMDPSVDRHILGVITVQQGFLSRKQINDRRTQGAVEHLRMNGNHVILVTSDRPLRDGCRGFSAPGRGAIRIIHTTPPPDRPNDTFFQRVLQLVQRRQQDPGFQVTIDSLLEAFESEGNNE